MISLREILAHLGITVTSVENKYVFWALGAFAIIGIITVAKYLYSKRKKAQEKAQEVYDSLEQIFAIRRDRSEYQKQKKSLHR